MVVVPTNNFKLIQLPIELDENNQLLFTSKTNQYNYFNNLPSPSYKSNYTYIRESGVVRYDDNIENIQQYNYCMYQNESYGNKWFYARIVDMTYANNDCTFIRIETDYFQTWFLDCTFNQSFIEREHVSDDTFGKHTLHENLETGEFLVSEKFTCVLPNNYIENPSYFIVALSSNLRLWSRYQMTQYIEALLGKVEYYYPFTSGDVYNGVSRNYQLWGVPYSNKQLLSLILERIQDYNQSNYIRNICIIPSWLLGENGEAWYSSVTSRLSFTGNDDDSNGLFLPTSSNAQTLTQDINPSNYLGNSLYGTYSPKNNKCLTSQFNHIVISNKNGQHIQLRLERWKKVNNNYRCFIAGVLNDSGCEIKIYPYQYNYIFDSTQANVEQLTNVSLALSPYPNFAVGVENYNSILNRFTQKSNLTGLASGGSAILGALTGNIGMVGAGIGGMTASALSPIVSQNELYKQSFQNYGNDTQSLDSTYSKGNTFIIQRYSVDYEHAKMIDDYFQMYGYKVNELKTPNLRSRVNFNYIKTIGANIHGNVPNKALEYLRGLFNNGITLWHNPSTYLSYSSNNIR